jgi:hypothetical protein
MVVLAHACLLDESGVERGREPVALRVRLAHVARRRPRSVERGGSRSRLESEQAVDQRPRVVAGVDLREIRVI